MYVPPSGLNASILASIHDLESTDSTASSLLYLAVVDVQLCFSTPWLSRCWRRTFVARTSSEIRRENCLLRESPSIKFSWFGWRVFPRPWINQPRQNMNVGLFSLSLSLLFDDFLFLLFLFCRSVAMPPSFSHFSAGWNESLFARERKSSPIAIDSVNLCYPRAEVE